MLGKFCEFHFSKAKFSSGKCLNFFTQSKNEVSVVNSLPSKENFIEPAQE
jgi:hypothetical protein